MLCVEAAPALVLVPALPEEPVGEVVPEVLVVVAALPAASVVVVVAPVPASVHTGGAESPAPATELYCGHWLRAEYSSELWELNQVRASDS